jgi:hypothetical protein
MFVISHRGNTNGRNPKTENLPEHILELTSSGIEVEIDVWAIESKYFLGHDVPQYEIRKDFLSTNPLLWCHAKNLQALKDMIECDVHCFWHQDDDYTLTSKNYIWTYPDKPTIFCKSVIVDLTTEWKNKKYNCSGICVDYL